MLQKLTLTVAVCGVVAGFGLAAATAADKKEPLGAINRRGPGPIYKSPQAAHAGVKKALAEGDWKTVCDSLTDDSRDELAGTLILMPLMTRAMAVGLAADPKGKDEVAAKIDREFKPLLAVLKKHGVPKEPLKPKFDRPRGNGLKDTKGSKGLTPADMRQHLIRMASGIKDRRAFIVEFMATLKKNGQLHKGAAPVLGELGDVQVKGLTGVDVVTRDGQQVRTPLTFARVGSGTRASWRVNLPANLGNSRVKGTALLKGPAN